MRAIVVALTAGFSGLLATGGFAAAAWLDVFTRCRVAYRVSDTVYGSIECQSYSALSLLSAVLALAACGLAVIAGILFVVRRRTTG